MKMNDEPHDATDYRVTWKEVAGAALIFAAPFAIYILPGLSASLITAISWLAGGPI